MALAKTFCPAVAIFDSSFRFVDDYYRMFPHEMADRKIWGLDIMERKRVAHLTFQGLLETMRDSMRANPSWDDFLIVAHGYHDDVQAYGLAMPLAPRCQNAPTAVDFLRPLLDFLNKGASADEIDAFEKDTGITITDSHKRTLKPHFQPGSLRTIVGLMRELRALKVRRVEIRACELGNNPDALEVLGKCFSALWIGAPDVHMFYTRAVPGRTASKAKLLRDLPGFPGIRVFTRAGDAFTFQRNGPQVPTGYDGSDSFAFQIQGRGVTRTNFTETTLSDLSWFADKFIWEGSSYPRVQSGMATPLMIAGMDLFGSKRYVLPQEPEYSQHLIYKGPLAGNQI
jgi:hypothetical protein